MARRKTLDDDGVANLKPRSKRYAHPDPELASHYVRVTPSGAKSFVVVVRDRDARQRWITIGPSPAYSVQQARKRAGEIIRTVREGKTTPESFEAVAAKWRKLHCEAQKLRSIAMIDVYLKRMNLEWTGREFKSIGRGDIAKLLDKIESGHGQRSANYALQVFSALANWYSARDDDYRSPVVRGMKRGKPIKRDRILEDDELRAIWKAAEANGQYGAFIRLLLLTGQRREKVAAMRWDDVSESGTWSIPTEKREKGNAGDLVLPRQALDIINQQPRFASNPYVFVGRGNSHFSAYSMAKRAFEAKLPDMPQWQLHDLRRTARTLMERAGVRPDIAERVLGHTIKGVEGVYNRHEYREEKAHALNALAALIEGIVNPQDNVTPMRRTL